MYNVLRMWGIEAKYSVPLLPNHGLSHTEEKKRLMSPFLIQHPYKGMAGAADKYH